MNHDWDVYTSTEVDTCKICGLVRRIRANMLNNERSIINVSFREYLIDGVWKTPKEVPEARYCKQKHTIR